MPSKTKKGGSSQAPKQFALKQIGQNLIIVTPEGEQLSKRFPDKEERESVKDLVKLYNERNAIKRHKEIVKIFTSETIIAKTQKKASKKAAKKKGNSTVRGTKQATKSKVNKSTAKEALKRKTAKKKTQAVPEASSTKRRHSEY